MIAIAKTKQPAMNIETLRIYPPKNFESLPVRFDWGYYRKVAPPSQLMFQPFKSLISFVRAGTTLKRSSTIP